MPLNEIPCKNYQSNTQDQLVDDKKGILTEKENESKVKPKPKGTIRGKAAMLLLDSTSESDGEAESCGIYGNVIQNTKKELADTKTKFENDESKYPSSC